MMPARFALVKAAPLTRVVGRRTFIRIPKNPAAEKEAFKPQTFQVAGRNVTQATGKPATTDFLLREEGWVMRFDNKPLSYEVSHPVWDWNSEPRRKATLRVFWFVIIAGLAISYIPWAVQMQIKYQPEE